MYVHGVKDISKETGFWTQMELYTRRHTTLLGGMDLLFFLSAGSGSENLIPRGKFSILISPREKIEHLSSRDEHTIGTIDSMLVR